MASASASCQRAFKWILFVEDESATFNKLNYTGHFEQLDLKLYTELDNSIPESEFYLRQKMRQKTAEMPAKHMRMSGRQLLKLVYDHFGGPSPDRSIVDLRRIQSLSMNRQNIKAFFC